MSQEQYLPPGLEDAETDMWDINDDNSDTLPSKDDFIANSLVHYGDGVQDDNNQTCVCEICLDRYNEPNFTDTPILIRDCGHIFGEKCLLTWFKKFKRNTCPKDRHVLFNLPPDDDESDGDEEESDEEEDSDEEMDADEEEESDEDPWDYGDAQRFGYEEDSPERVEEEFPQEEEMDADEGEYMGDYEKEEVEEEA